MASSVCWTCADSYFFNSKMRCGAVRCGAGLCPFPRWGRAGMGASGGGLANPVQSRRGPRFCSLSLRERAGVRASSDGKNAAFARSKKPVPIATGALFAEVRSRVSPRRARHFSLSRQRKVPQRKATPLPVTPALCAGATCGARAGRGLAQTRLRLKQSQALVRPVLRSSARSEGRVGESPMPGQPDSRTAGQPDSRTFPSPKRAKRPIARLPLRHAPAASHPRS